MLVEIIPKPTSLMWQNYMRDVTLCDLTRVLCDLTRAVWGTHLVVPCRPSVCPHTVYFIGQTPQRNWALLMRLRCEQTIVAQPRVTPAGGVPRRGLQVQKKKERKKGNFRDIPILPGAHF